jgi:CRP-like cAMP-binding protein
MDEILGKTKFHFLKYLPGNECIREGEVCTNIKFLLSGSLRVTISNEDGRFRVLQTLNAPAVIFPDYLFGLETFYPGTAVAVDTANLVQMSKSDFLSILHSDQVFMLNYLNMLSLNGQRTLAGVLALTAGSIDQRLAFWVNALTRTESTDIVIECRQRDLYSVFGVQRTSFLAALEAMKQRGLIDYSPTQISIVNRRELVEILR